MNKSRTILGSKLWGQFLFRASWIVAVIVILIIPCLLSDNHDHIAIAAETPFFSEPTTTSQVIAIADRPLNLPTFGRRRCYIEHYPQLQGKWQMLMAITDFYRVKIGTTRWAWVSQDLLYDLRRQQFSARPLPRQRDSYYLLSVLALMVVAAMQLVKQKRTRVAAAPADHSLFLSLLLVLLGQWALVIFLRCLSGQVISYPIDEHGYHQIAADIAAGYVSLPWVYTIGLPLWYLPLVIINASQNYFAIETMVRFANSMLLMPLSSLAVFLLVYRLERSLAKAALCVVLSLAMAVFYFPIIYLKSGGVQLYKAVFAFPVFNIASRLQFYINEHLGINGMSDALSCCLLLFSILAALYLPLRKRYTLLIAIVFGYNCLIRLPNVCFLPLFAYIIWHRLANHQQRSAAYLAHIGVAFISLLLLSLPQMLANYYQFAGYFTFPHVLHPARVAEGFAVDALGQGCQFLVSTNYLYLVLCIWGLSGMADGFTRRLLVLWGLPLTIFYCGYPDIANSGNPIRFLLPVHGAWLAAVVCCPTWKRLSAWRKPMLIAIIALAALTVAPCQRQQPPYHYLLHLYDWGADLVAISNLVMPALTIGLICLCYFRQRKVLVHGLGFALLFFSGSPYLIAVVAIGLVAQTLVVITREIIGQINQELPSLRIRLGLAILLLLIGLLWLYRHYDRSRQADHRATAPSPTPPASKIVSGQPATIPGFSFQKRRVYRCAGIVNQIAQYRHRATGMSYILIPGGSFQMGDSISSNSQPRHLVTVKPFLLAQCEVTQGIWRRVMGTAPWQGKRLVHHGDNYPAVYISWRDAQKFCHRLGLRLPNEAEWEYACRAGSVSRYYWGEQMDRRYCHYDDQWWAFPSKYGQVVATKLGNAFGLFDMSGNVWEWCQDRYHPNYRNAPVQAVPWIDSGDARVVRSGGRCFFGAINCASASRGRFHPDFSCSRLGFRPALSVIEETR